MNKSKLKVFIFLIAVFILLIFFHLINFDQKITQKFYQLGFKLGARVSNLSIVNLKNYQQENLFLNQKINKLLADNIRFKILAEENATLKKYLNLSVKNKERLIVANIIGQRQEMSFKWFILDLGSQDGIRTSLPVIDENGFLLGKINRVTENFSYLLPLFDSHSLVAVDIIKSIDKESGGARFTSGLVKGKHGLSMEIDYIPLDKMVEKGDFVVTSGLEPEIKRGLIVGQIEEVIKESSAPFQKAIVKPLINFDTVRIVGILIPIYAR